MRNIRFSVEGYPMKAEFEKDVPPFFLLPTLSHYFLALFFWKLERTRALPADTRSDFLPRK